jgi:Beta-propeller repeat
MRLPAALAILLGAQVAARALALSPPTALPLTLPLGFEPNVGQADPEARFVAHAPGLNLFLTARGAVWTIPPETPAGPPRAVQLSALGASRRVRLEALERLAGNANYLIGSTPERWHTDIPTYRQVVHHGLYRGVDLVSHGDRGAFEFDFAVAPGGDAAAIAFRIDGADRLTLDASGDLRIQVGTRELRLKHPEIYQERAGRRERVEGRYLLAGSVVRFRLGVRDPHAPLLIDPVLNYAVALGGSDADQGKGVAVDAAGEAFIVGSASSLDFPLKAPFQPAFGGGSSDAFVAKLSADGATLLYSTYLGGGQDDFGAGIAVGADGTATVTGYTKSIDFPVKIPFQRMYGGGLFDAFVTRLSPDGSNLAYSTYYGGNDLDQGLAIAVDVAGRAFLTGGTSSANLPSVAPVQAQFQGIEDAFLAIFSPDGTTVQMATYLGGSDSDLGWAITTDALGQVYLAGSTSSLNFPLANPYQPTYRGNQDAFLTMINPADAGLVFSTYFGGSNEDTGRAVAVDAKGIIYLAGGTYSGDLFVNQPFRGVAVQPAIAGDKDGYLIAIDLATPDAPIKTFYGGSDADEVIALALDGAGNIYLAGETFSTDFPVSTPLQQPDGGDNAFLVNLVDGGSQIGWATLLGGSADDKAYGVTTDDAGAIFVVGTTSSADFPGLRSEKIDGGLGISAAFVVRIGAPVPDAGPLDAGPDLDGGPDGGPTPPDAGAIDAGQMPPDAGGPAPSTQGCSCGDGRGAGAPISLLVILLLLAIRGRIRPRLLRG